MDVELAGEIQDAETVASGRALRELRRLRKAYGGVNWCKCKGTARVRSGAEGSGAGEMVSAEVHWYEAHGIGQVEMKLKRYL